MNKIWNDKAWEEYIYWSRRIDEKNRIVYKQQNGQIIIVQCGGHYEN